MANRDEGTVTVDRDGKRYEGTYRIHKGVLTVSTSWGSKSTHVGGSRDVPEVLARIMLGELVTEHAANER